jgi:S-DNA-T family DNA segregation ATPase FtsK/SpoIIIE
MTRRVWVLGWVRQHPRWCATWVLVAGCTAATGDLWSGLMLLAAGLAPGLVCGVWHGLAPAGYERWCAGPLRRAGWRRVARHRWAGICESCGLSTRVPVKTWRHGARVVEHHQVAPRLLRARTRGHLLELTIRARAGQTVEDLNDAAPRLAATLAAVAHRTRPVSGAGSGCTTVVELVMADTLTSWQAAPEPEPRAVCDRVRLGRAQAGRDWWLQLRGRHTLVAGCSGSGKGSVLWGICCGLAPAVRADLVRLWGVDLKRGVELAMGAGLFSAHAYTPEDALTVLRALMAVIDERGHAMAGTTRLHEPVVGDPMHVLVIDELAALTAYADPSIRREAERLLSEILTQGRALGVVVVACVQDPRKDVVAMRGLFTQTIALRLRSSEETAMVLGDGMTRVAPAHRISPTYPGTGWVVEDTGAADRVRADYWPDHLIRDIAARYATPVQVDPTDLVPPVSPDANGPERRPRRDRADRGDRPRRPTVVREGDVA